MTNQEKRIAIAEFCGWKHHASDTHPKWDWWEHPKGFEVDDYKYGDHHLPDYLSDLNAMHEAWLFLRKGEGLSELEAESRRTTYGEQLEFEANKQIEKTGGAFCYVLANLTAQQRADALLMTIGKI